MCDVIFPLGAQDLKTVRLQIQLAGLYQLQVSNPLPSGTQSDQLPFLSPSITPALYILPFLERAPVGRLGAPSVQLLIPGGRSVIGICT